MSTHSKIPIRDGVTKKVVGVYSLTSLSLHRICFTGNQIAKSVMEMLRSMVYERSSEVFNIRISKKKIYQRFDTAQSSFYIKDHTTYPIIKSLSDRTNLYHHYLFELGMKATDDPKQEFSEKNLPFRKRTHQPHTQEQYQQDSSQTSDVPPTLKSIKTEVADTKRSTSITSNISSENQDSSRQSSTKELCDNAVFQPNECESRTCCCEVCRQKHGNLPLLVQVITDSEKTEIQKESEILIPVTVESLPSTSCSSPKKSALSCTHCGKEFHHKGDMNKHLRTHTKEQPYSCNLCPSKFSHTSNLHRHLRIHSGIKPYSCDICKKTFSRADKLQLHQKSKICKKNKMSE